MVRRSTTLGSFIETNPCPAEPLPLVRCKEGMRKLLAGLGLSVALLVVVAPAAWAGGWAVSTLDPMSAPVAGVPTDIGFTIRQHGVTPVDVNDVAIVVTAPSGETAVFPANGDGVEGHYVASVTFEEGQSTWQIRQGFFEPQDLGAITVAAGASSALGSVESSSYRWPGAARALVPLAAIALATVAIADAIVSRRKKSPVS